MAWGWRGRGGWISPWPGRGPFSYLPPWQRPGWLFGFGRGLGRLWWAYFYNPWAIYNPWVCARFPWLPRWWWAYPYYWYWWSYGYPYYWWWPYYWLPAPYTIMPLGG